MNRGSGMNRWAVPSLVVLLGVAAGGGVWRGYDLGRELDEARERVRQLEAAKRSESDAASFLSHELKRKDERLARRFEDVKSARRSLREAQRVAGNNLCFDDVVGLEPGFLRGPLVADVDGDGSADRVYALGRRIVLRGTCRYFLVVKTDSSTYRARVRAGELGLHRFSLPAFFIPQSAAQLDARPGLELLIGVHHGAAVVFGTVYTINGGSLVGLDISDEDVDTFGYEGGLCCGGALNCEGDAIVYAEYGRAMNGRGYAVTRRFYEVSASSLVRTREESHRLGASGLDQFKEFGGRALSHCRDYVEMKPG